MGQKQETHPFGRVARGEIRSPNSGIEAEFAEPFIELCNLAAGIDQSSRAACPRRVRLWIDIESQRVSLAAPSGARLKTGPICHDDSDRVVVGMKVFFHRHAPENYFLLPGGGLYRTGTPSRKVNRFLPSIGPHANDCVLMRLILGSARSNGVDRIKATACSG